MPGLFVITSRIGSRSCSLCWAIFEKPIHTRWECKRANKSRRQTRTMSNDDAVPDASGSSNYEPVVDPGKKWIIGPGGLDGIVDVFPESYWERAVASFKCLENLSVGAR